MKDKRNSTDQPWYHKGLKFECSECGDCCTGGPGCVWVNEQEIAEMAKSLDLTAEQFERQYVMQTDDGKSLRELPDRNWDCIFLGPESRKCMLYDLRPRQCRTWPFWKSNVESPTAWKETCRVCPGSGRGQLVPLLEIETQLDVIDI